MSIRRVVLISLAVLSACSDGIIPPGGSGIASVEISPGETLLLLEGDSIQFSALARLANGEIVRDATLTWSSSAPDTVAISPTTGRAVVLADGQAWIKARADAAVDSVRVGSCPFSSARSGSRFEAWVAPGYFLNAPMAAGRYTAAQFDERIVLWGGALMFGTSLDDAVVAKAIFGLFRDDVDGGGRVCEIATSEGDYTRTNLRVVKDGRFPTVKVEQETFAPRVASLNQILLVRYTFSNTGTAAINSFRAGMVMDWDVWIDPAKTVGANFSRLNRTLDAAETFQDGLQTAGIASISSSITSYQSFPHNIRVFERNEYFAPMLAGIVNPEGIGPADVREVVGFAPFDIPVGESRSLVFVMTAGHSRADFQNAVQAARAVATAFPRRVLSVPD